MNVLPWWAVGPSIGLGAGPGALPVAPTIALTVGLSLLPPPLRRSTRARRSPPALTLSPLCWNKRIFVRGSRRHRLILMPSFEDIEETIGIIMLYLSLGDR